MRIMASKLQRPYREVRVDTLAHVEGCLLGMAIGEARAALTGRGTSGDVPVVSDTSWRLGIGSRVAMIFAEALATTRELPLEPTDIGAQLSALLVEAHRELSLIHI